MISITSSQLQFYQNKIYKLEMDHIMLQQELMAFKNGNNDQYKLKYQILLEKYTHQVRQKENINNQFLASQELNNKVINEKLENMVSEKVNELNTEIQKLKSQKNILKNKLVELQLKNISISSEENQEDIQILRIKLDSLKKQNQKSKHDIFLLQKQLADQKDNQQILLQRKQQQIKERQKGFYRQTILNLELEIQRSRQLLQQEKERNNPERQSIIQKLIKDKQLLTNNQNVQLEKYVILLQKGSKQQNKLKEYIKTKEQEYMNNLREANDRSKSLQTQLFQRKHNEQMRIINIVNQMTQKRENQAKDSKIEIQNIQKQFQKERQQNKIIKKQFQEENLRIKRQWEQQKSKYLEQKNKLKQKIDDLRQKIKSKQVQSNHNETQNIVNSLMEIGINKQQFQSYQSTVTFMSRQNKKLVMKMQEKDRQITNLLQELKNLQEENEKQIHQIRDKNRKDQKKLFKKAAKLQQQIDNMNDLMKQKQKQYKIVVNELKFELETKETELKNIKKINQEMQNDYDRLTHKKKNLQDSFRQERQNVVTAKVDINQQKKKKWVELERQKTLLQIVYRERQIKLIKEHQIKIQKLKLDREKLIEDRQKYRAQASVLKQRLNLPNDENKTDILEEYHKKLATLDLQIALTQNVFETLSSATVKKSTQKHNRDLRQISNPDFSIESSQYQESQAEPGTPHIGRGGQDNLKETNFSFISKKLNVNSPAKSHSKNNSK